MLTKCFALPCALLVIGSDARAIDFGDSMSNNRPGQFSTAQLAPSTSEAQGLVSRLKANLLIALKADPKSAQFRDEFLSRPEDSSSNIRSLCGYVNYKTTDGGASGFVAFIVNTNGLVAIDTDESSAFRRYLWTTWCSVPV